MSDYDFGYSEVFSEEEISKINNEFCRLKGVCYLDQTGSSLYPKSYIEAVTKDLCDNLYSNPHSNSLKSKLCLDTIDQVRYRVLQYFNTKSNEYSVIFTSGATGALKLIAESFMWKSDNESDNEWFPKERGSSKILDGGEFVYMEDNHTSVLGMRDLVKERGANLRCLTQEETLNAFRYSSEIPQYELNNGHNSLFVYSAQSNFSGVKYPLSWIDKVHKGILNSKCSSQSRWYCLLDAATHASTNPLDLSKAKPDFVCLSFYKIFGYPTGLGALLVKNTSANILRKSYYGGGTVLIALSLANSYIPRPLLHERFEDGSLNFLSIISLRHGFNTMEKLVGNMDRISKHCFDLAKYLFYTLLRMHHCNGEPVVHLYFDTAYSDINFQGNIVNFNILRSNGEYVGYAEALNMANLHGIQLRTGCFCNPGACRHHLGLSTQDLKFHYQAGHVCGDDKDLVEGKPTGSVRVSFGLLNKKGDADALIELIEKCYAQQPIMWKLPHNWDSISHQLDNKFSTSCDEQVMSISSACPQNIINIRNLEINDHSSPEIIENTKLQNIGEPEYKKPEKPFLSHIYLYPIKSCGKFEVKTWQVDSKGLKYDRGWMIINDSGVALTQKRESKLCLINPSIDLLTNELHLSYEGCDSISISMEAGAEEKQVGICQSKVCGDRVEGIDCGDEVADWLSQVLERPGLRLLRQLSSDSRKGKRSSDSLSLTNQAQYLLINKTSVDWLGDHLQDLSGSFKGSMIDRFRSNFVISGVNEPLIEQTWSQIIIGEEIFKVEGPCGRCQMICIDQNTGVSSKEPLTTLCSALKGKMKFGIYLSRLKETSATITINEPVACISE